MVLVYGKPECVQCIYTVKQLVEKDIPYEYHDIIAEEDARRVVLESGKTQLPFVVAGPDSWHGFYPDRIKALVSA